MQNAVLGPTISVNYYKRRGACFVVFQYGITCRILNQHKSIIFPPHVRYHYMFSGLIVSHSSLAYYQLLNVNGSSSSTQHIEYTSMP
jgi:hypothetical protein